MNLDPVNIEIMRLLKNGRKSAKAIADEIGVSHNTVRRRIDSLIQNGILEIKGLVATDNLPHHMLAIIGINLRTRNLTKRVREICALEGVISAGVVTGRYDIIALIMLNNENDLLKFHTKQMPNIKDITFTETFVMYKNENWKVPYVL